jgi:hypothetical protein
VLHVLKSHPCLAFHTSLLPWYVHGTWGIHCDNSKWLTLYTG